MSEIKVPSADPTTSREREIRERIAKATPGPWRADDEVMSWLGGAMRGSRVTAPIGEATAWRDGAGFQTRAIAHAPVAMCPSDGYTQTLEDAALIANAPTDLQWLLDECSSLRSQLATRDAAIRWALGEEGGFTPAPDLLLDRLIAGRIAMQREGRGSVAPSRLYWWRSELRERAGIAAAPISEGETHVER